MKTLLMTAAILSTTAGAIPTHTVSATGRGYEYDGSAYAEAISGMRHKANVLCEALDNLTAKQVSPISLAEKYFAYGRMYVTATATYICQ